MPRPDDPRETIRWAARGAARRLRAAGLALAGRNPAPPRARTPGVTSPSHTHTHTADPPEFRTIYDWKPDIDDLPSRRRRSFPEITDELFWEAFEQARPYSMLHVPGFFNLYQSLHHIARNRLAGDLVECGCFLGGSSIFIGLVRAQLGLDDRDLVVFDTFEGFPVGSADRWHGREVIGPRHRNFFEAVVANFERTCGTDGVRFVQGPVEETLPGAALGDLALVRLDTDFYPSTAIELQVLYPRLVAGGVLVVDDYLHFEGSFRATNEYLDGLDAAPLLLRIDGGAVSGVKPA